MRAFLVGACCALLLVGAAEARPHNHAAPVSPGSADYYTNTSGHQVHRPVQASQRPAGASARCADGTYSFSEHRRGTCSHHGGVVRWF